MIGIAAAIGAQIIGGTINKSGGQRSVQQTQIQSPRSFQSSIYEKFGRATSRRPRVSGFTRPAEVSTGSFYGPTSKYNAIIRKRLGLLTSTKA